MPDADSSPATQEELPAALRAEAENVGQAHAARLTAELTSIAATIRRETLEAAAAERQEALDAAAAEFRQALDAAADDKRQALEAAADEKRRALESADAEMRRVLDEFGGAVRKIRGAGAAADVLAELVDTAARTCGAAVLLLHTEGRVVGFRSAGGREDFQTEQIHDLAFDLVAAPAIAHAVESRGTVVTKGAQEDVSKPLAALLGEREGGELRIHPLVLRDTVLAILLVASGPENAARVAMIETLVLVAEAWVEALGSRSEGN